MKQNLLIRVYAKSVTVEDVVSPPEGARLRYVHPVYEVYMTSECFSVAGREEEIRHAALVGIQARGEHAGDMRYHGVRKRRKSNERVSDRQLPLFPLEGFVEVSDEHG